MMLDLTGYRCPIPLLTLKQYLNNCVDSREEVILLVNKESLEDIKLLLGNKIMDVTSFSESGIYKIIFHS